MLVGDDGVIAAGHGRAMAARKQGLSEAPVIVLSHLTATQRLRDAMPDRRYSTQICHEIFETVMANSLKARTPFSTEWERGLYQTSQ